MAVKLWPMTTVNKFSTTLTSTITDSDTSMTLTSVTGLDTAGGILSVDRVNSGGTATPSQTEYVSYTGITTKTLTTLSRGLAGSTAQEHSAGAIVEGVWTVTHMIDLIDFLEVSHASDGTMKSGTTFASPVINTAISGTAFLDQDDMSDNSATKVSSQQAIKAYADSLGGRRTTTEASSGTPTINTDNTDIHTITALAAAITSMTTNLSGTPVNGQKIIIRILDDGTARAITWGSSFASRGATLPTITVLSKYQYNGFIYNSTTSTWDLVATVNES